MVAENGKERSERTEAQSLLTLEDERSDHDDIGCDQTGRAEGAPGSGVGSCRDQTEPRTAVSAQLLRKCSLELIRRETSTSRPRRLGE